MSLADDRRSKREKWLDVDGHEYLVRRPTAFQFALWKDEPIDGFLALCVINWRNVTREDLGLDGEGECPFDAELFRDWVQDEPVTMNTIYKDVVDSITKYWEAREKIAKKSKSFSMVKA